MNIDEQPCTKDFIRSPKRGKMVKEATGMLENDNTGLSCDKLTLFIDTFIISNNTNFEILKIISQIH